MTKQITEFDSKAFRRALGNFATGITVITAATPDGEKVGVTANSFNSVSMEPPLILWSIDKRSGSYPVFEKASHFAVNVLAADQTHLSNHFAKPNDDKFDGIDWEAGAGGAPLLPDCAAAFECECFEIVEGGDHWILIGKVVSFDDVGRAPLLYHQGSYSMVLPHSRFPEKTQDVEPTISALEGRLSNNLYYLMTQAVRSFQADYQPKQMSTGLRTSEARMLMVMEHDRALDIDALLKEVNMPRVEIENAAGILQRKGLISQDEGLYRITTAGLKQAASLWQIAEDEQNQVFGKFSEEELKIFRKVLTTII